MAPRAGLPRASGSPQPLSPELEQYRASLRRLAWSYTRNSAQRDDLFQEIALAIWRARPGFRGECSERTFVFRIAHNRGLSFLARHADSPEVIDDVDAWQARDVNPEGRLAARQDVEHLRQAVSELPLAYRQVVMLALEDLSYAEIGEVLGITGLRPKPF